MRRQAAITLLGAAAFALLAYSLAQGAPGAAPGPARAVDLARSSVTVRVYKSGLFSAFAHDHTVQAPIGQAQVTVADHPSVELAFDSRLLTVLDPNSSPQERAEIQRTMLGPQVLDSQRFPEISFRSTSVQAVSPGQWEVRGELTLHGQTQPLTFEVSEGDGGYSGKVRLRQTQFGITPIRIAGGTVKVKDEVVVEFQIAIE